MNSHPVNSQRSVFGRNFLLAAALAVTAVGAAHAQAYVNITAGGAFAPGVYGQIFLGNNPPPPVINEQPVFAGPMVYGAPVMYLHVPPEEYRDWPRYCNRYQACGRPVHFVRVDNNNRWWERRNEHLRGEGYYIRPGERGYDHRNDGRGTPQALEEQRRRAEREENRH